MRPRIGIDLAVAVEESKSDATERRIRALMERMTLAEKIGQMSQVNGDEGRVSADLRAAIRAGRVGSILNEVDPATLETLQRVAVEESRLGIPLIFGRDVIHGFQTIFPIPIGQAATWNSELVQAAARVAAQEAASVGLHWTFAPMVDICRDPRWGRVAESLGEDPHLASVLAVAMIRGFQGPDLATPDSLAACAKHFAGYGASESGKDYNTTNIPENELRNVYLRPFKAAVEAGVATLMTSFSDLDGVPASANGFLLQQILRQEWEYDGFVVGDWDAIRQLSVHGLTENDRESAYEAVTAGLDMEMAGDAYAAHLEGLVASGRVPVEAVDIKVANILRIKARLGLFETPRPTIGYDSSRASPPAPSDALLLARQVAQQSLVLLRNERGVLPLDESRLRSIAVLGPMANEAYEQLGTWIFDGDESLSVSGLRAIQERFEGVDITVRYAPAMETTRSRATAAFDEAIVAASASDVAIVFVGEESILSGEAHSRASIDLPGAQVELLRRLRSTQTPVVAVVLAGRPLTLTGIVDEVDALLFAWHPGAMAGPAIADVLFGAVNPSGRLPVSFPRAVGQIPVYYNHKNTGRPPLAGATLHIDDIQPRAPQTSFGMTAFYLDIDHTPLFEFGYGLSYTRFTYSDIEVSAQQVNLGQSFTVAATVHNVGDVDGDEVVQLYVRDLVGSTTRPVRELKGFRRVRLRAGEQQRITFTLSTEDLAFYGRDQRLATEPGQFRLWIGGSARAELTETIRVVSPT